MLAASLCAGLVSAAGGAVAPGMLAAYGPATIASVPASVLGGLASVVVSPDGLNRYYGTFGGGLYKAVVGTSATTTLRLPDFTGNSMLGVDVRADGNVLFAAGQSGTSRTVLATALSGVPKTTSHTIGSTFAFDLSVSPDASRVAIAAGESIVIQDAKSFATRTIVLPRTIESSLSAKTVAFSPSGLQIFFANGADRIESVALDGTKRALLATGLSQPSLGAIDKFGRLYVGTSDTSAPLTAQILRFSADGSLRTLVYTGFDQIQQVSIDASGSLTFLSTRYSGQSSTVNIVSLALRNLPPGSPKVTAVGNGRVGVSWTKTTEAQTSYTVTSSTSPVRSCTTTGLTCVVTGLVHGRPTSFTVTSSNGFVTSVKSPPTATARP